jgi:hypothetical protein
VDNSRELREPGAVQGGGRPTERRPDSTTAGALLVRPARGFVRFLYSSNPFYILSADLFFVGLRISFGSGGSASRTWALWLGLAGFTLLLAATACFLIRKGKLWDDLRSILLLIVMMFVAMATSGDDTMAADLETGALVCAAGFLFAVVVTESVLRGIRLRLPGWYRAAYHVVLGLVFLYPIALAPALLAPESPRLQWALFGFSPLVALAFLLLIPAARRGPVYVAKNGSPWRWPLYPWSLFFVIAGGVGVRCYSLCVSFHFVNGSQTIFGPYFLVPLGLAFCLIWLEIAIAVRRKGVMIAASAMPLFLALLATTGHRYEVVYMNFLGMFRQTLGGTPVFVTLIAATIFLAYAIVRRVPLAWELLSVALVALAMVGPGTLDLNELVTPRPLPLAAAGLILGSVALRIRHSFRGVLAALLLVISATLGWAEVWPTADRAMVAIHLLVVGMMAVGAFFDDRLGELAQSCATLALLVLGIASAVHVPVVANSLPANLAPWHPLFVMVATVAYGILLRDRIYLAIAGAGLAAWVGFSTYHSYYQLRRIVAGLDQIAFGLLFFVIAAAISLKKARLWPRSIVKAIARHLRA